jgi:hypothetical protein
MRGSSSRGFFPGLGCDDVGSGSRLRLRVPTPGWAPKVLTLIVGEMVSPSGELAGLSRLQASERVESLSQTSSVVDAFLVRRLAVLAALEGPEVVFKLAWAIPAAGLSLSLPWDFRSRVFTIGPALLRVCAVPKP